MVTLTKIMRDKLTPQKALEMLQAGNNRFVTNLKLNRNLLQQVNETSDEQYPFAFILSCIDSRTSAELIFDQGLGDIFSCRIAGNILNDDIIGSMEFACKISGPAPPPSAGNRRSRARRRLHVAAAGPRGARAASPAPQAAAWGLKSRRRTKPSSRQWGPPGANPRGPSARPARIDPVGRPADRPRSWPRCRAAWPGSTGRSPGQALLRRPVGPRAGRRWPGAQLTSTAELAPWPRAGQSRSRW